MFASGTAARPPAANFDEQAVSGIARNEPNLPKRIKHIDPSGKEVPIFGNHVKPRHQKYFASYF
jgi:hypothetical protein